MKKLLILFLRIFSISLLCDVIRKKAIKKLRKNKRKTNTILLILRKIDELRKLIKTL